MLESWALEILELVFVDQRWAFHLEWRVVCISFFSSSSLQEKAAGNLGARL